MKKKLFKIAKLIRPKQWLKNLAVYAAIIFTGQLFNITIFEKVTIGFLAFCSLSSAIYIINDLFDIQKDRMHPFKKFRPLAHRDISVPFAIGLAVFLLIVALILGLMVRRAFFFTLLTYLILQVCYSLILKNIAIIDILTLATGYMLRVYGGEFASGYHISVWMLLTTIALSLFLAVGKRKSELTLISHLPDTSYNSVRQSLSHYSNQLLDVYASIFATSTFIFYSLFTFLESPSFKPSIGILLPDFLPDYFQRKWLMITIVPVVYGIMRYLQDIYEKHEGESPERVLLSDSQLLIAVGIWAILVVIIIYTLGG